MSDFKPFESDADNINEKHSANTAECFSLSKFIFISEIR